MDPNAEDTPPPNMPIAPPATPLTMTGMPTIRGRGTPQRDVDMFNEQMRANPEYQALIATMGRDKKGQVSLSENDRKRIAAWLATKGVNVDKGLKIDQAGNINQKNRTGKIMITAALIGGTLATAGALGAFAGPAVASGAAPSLGVTGGLAAGSFPAIAGTTGAGLAGATGAGIAAGALPMASTLSGVGGTAAAGLPSSLAGTTITGSQLAGLGGTAATTGTRAGGSLLSKLINKDTLGTIADSLGAVAGTQAHNRGAALDAMMEADKMDIAMRKDRREEESDIWKKLNAANYIQAGTPEYKPQYSSSGEVIPRFDTGLRDISQEDKDVATALEKQLMERLNTIPKARQYDSKMQPGKIETGMNWLGPALKIAGSF